MSGKRTKWLRWLFREAHNGKSPRGAVWGKFGEQRRVDEWRRWKKRGWREYLAVAADARS